MEKIDIFNTPVEIGLRLLFIFKNSKKSLDIQRLVYYNYLIIHSSDIPEAPKSLHPQLPNRSCEILINRKLVLKAVKLLLLKDLISIKYNKSGITYHSNKNTFSFLINLNSHYSNELDERAKWIINKFDDLSDKKLTEFITANLGKWGGEFSSEPISTT